MDPKKHFPLHPKMKAQLEKDGMNLASIGAKSDTKTNVVTSKKPIDQNPKDPLKATRQHIIDKRPKAKEVEEYFQMLISSLDTAQSDSD